MTSRNTLSDVVYAHVKHGVCRIDRSMSFVVFGVVSHYVVWTRTGSHTGSWLEQEQCCSSVSGVDSNRWLTASGVDGDESLCLWSAQELVIYSVCKVDQNKVTSGSLFRTQRGRSYSHYLCGCHQGHRWICGAYISIDVLGQLMGSTRQWITCNFRR